MFIEVDTSTKPERKLLSSVVLLALNDACRKPIRTDRGIEMQVEAFTAMRFLFDTSVAGLNEFATWLDFDPDGARAALLKVMDDRSPRRLCEMETQDRRMFKQNYLLWCTKKGLDMIEEDEDNATV